MDTRESSAPDNPRSRNYSETWAPHVLCVLTLRTEQMKVGAPCLAGFARHGSLRTMGTMGSSPSGHSHVSPGLRDMGVSEPWARWDHRHPDIPMSRRVC